MKLTGRRMCEAHLDGEQPGTAGSEVLAVPRDHVVDLLPARPFGEVAASTSGSFESSNIASASSSVQLRSTRRSVVRTAYVGQVSSGQVDERIHPWTSPPPTPTGSRASRPARCRSRSPIPRRTPSRCSPRPGPATTSGVAVAIFPELCLSGYAIDDLVLQDPLLDAVRAAIEALVEAQPRPAARARRRRADRRRQPGLQLRGRGPRRRGARGRAEVLPADLPRVLRAAVVRPR